MPNTSVPQLPFLCLQIHDELLFDVSASHLRPIAALVHSVMEGTAAVWGMQLPLPVKLSTGPSWGQLAPYAA
jgi:DNA polymerase theta